MKSQLQYNRYLKFVENLKSQVIDGYFELHHIVPKSLGGSNDKSNLIKLTARQHYVAHWMLARALGGPAARAFFMMSNFGKYGKVNSATYEIARKEYSNQVSLQLKGKPSQCLFSDETLEKMSKAALGRKVSDITKAKLRAISLGKKRGADFAIKVSEAKKGKGNGRIGYKQSEETKLKIIQANFNRPIIECPHCLKSMKDHGGAKRWHFDRCKERKEAA